ncbi:carboxymuconolactone decarboxylase family protein [Pedobacter cryoconitis]|uniref:AhpD family alkylhydroperoxidase n=1 Tax=Pedobacter cryoconitis TaxID=188932 RepID=A0A7X0MIZ8_9SPHI|nr:carboxymuconolactone decarboxylase family protein [Pedobacter cryoconitis]MBB6499085.1 AhpD family alkylhydroperoxidase [Pedobacter cryoconitis]
MSNRIVIKKIEPEAYRIMYMFDSYLSKSNLTPIQRELIKIRTAQVNGCAYCIYIHTKEARIIGETETRIYALNAWKEGPFFSDEERAILALTEEVTLIQNGVSDETYNLAAQYFDERTLAQIIMAIIAINAYTRIAISTRMRPMGD